MEGKKEIYRIVIQEEIKAQNLYRILAKALNDSDSKQVFENLIRIEKMHEEKISELFLQEYPYHKINVDSNLTPLIKDPQKLQTPESALEFAISKEINAENLYLDLAENTTNSKQQMLFRNFAADERNHKKLLEDEINRLGGLMTWFDASELNGLMED